MDNKPLSVLIVDDSRVFRSAVEAVLTESGSFAIVGSVMSGAKALETLATATPDIVVIDHDMPAMDGRETLKVLRKAANNKERPSPLFILLVPGLKGRPEIASMAVAEGAHLVIDKDVLEAGDKQAEKIRDHLVLQARKLARKRDASGIDQVQPVAPNVLDARSVDARSVDARSVDAIVVAISTGGPKALADMLPTLTQTTRLPVLIVQHIPPDFSGSLASGLASRCAGSVVEAQNGALVEPGTVYIAPGGLHMLVKRGPDDTVVIELNEAPPEGGLRPCADLLFRSAAGVYGSRLLGLVMTGMGNDGTKGAATLKQAGARVVVQDEATSVVWGMPGSVVEAGLADAVVPLMEIPAAVAKLTVKGRHS